jgi:hypothetical protein
MNLNKEKMRVWRDEPLVARPPQVFISYPQEIRLGDDWELEVASLPYTTDQASVVLKLLDLNNKLIEESKPIDLPGDKELIHRFKFTDLGIKTPNRLKIQVKIVTDKNRDQEKDNWYRLYPLTIRPGQRLSMRTIRFNLSRMYDTYATTKIKDNQLTASLKGWAWTGKADLYQNTQFIASKDIAKFGGMDTRVSFDLTDVTPQYPRDLYAVRFVRDDGTILWSNPILVDTPGIDTKKTIDYPVLERHMTFDQAWMSQVTGYKLKARPYTISKQTLPLAEVFAIHLPMDHSGDGKTLAEIGGWHWPTLMGGNHRHPKITPDHVPQWVEQAGPDGSTRKLLHFDGKDDRIALKARSMPHDMATVEMWIKPENTGKNMMIFSDQNGGMDIGIDEYGKPFVQSHGKSVASDTALDTTQWTHLAGSYDGQFVRLWINGKEVAKVINPLQTRGINSLGLIGGLIREGRHVEQGYQGLMAGFALRALPAKGYGFILNNKQ